MWPSLESNIAENTLNNDVSYIIIFMVMQIDSFPKLFILKLGALLHSQLLINSLFKVFITNINVTIIIIPIIDIN